MLRLFVFLGSVLLAAISIGTAGLAADLGELRFAIASSTKAGQVRLELDDSDSGGGDRHRASTTSNVPERDLVGLAPDGFLAPGNRPLKFALIRAAGRADCLGAGGNGRGAGRCRFTADPSFMALVTQAGVRTVSSREAVGMLLVGVSRELVAAVRDAHYPNPTASELTGLAALGVTSDYIRDLDRRGYKPDKLGDLTAFKALGVTPEYVDGLVHAGFGRLAPADIVPLKALGVTPRYLAQLRAAGYAPFRSSEVVQMAALGVTPADFALFQASHGRVDVDRLVQAKALGLVGPQR